MIDCVVHVHVPGLGRGIDFVVEFVRPGSDDLLQIVVTELAVVKDCRRSKWNPFG